MWPVVVVDGGEGVQQCLELGEGGGLGILGGEPVLEGLLEPLGFALGLRVVRFAVFLGDARRRSSCSKALRPPLPPDSRVVNTIPLSVNVEAGMPCLAVAARKTASTMGPVTRFQAVTDTAYREWSSSQVKTSVPAPPASG